MADMMIVYRVMPEDGDIEYTELESVTKSTVESYHKSVKVKDVSAVSVGFGLQAVKIKFTIDENCGSESLEEKLKELEQVGDVTVELMDRM